MLWVLQELDAFQRRHPEQTLIVAPAREPRRQRAYQALRRRGFHVGWYRGEEVLYREAPVTPARR